MNLCQLYRGVSRTSGVGEVLDLLVGHGFPLF